MSRRDRFAVSDHSALPARTRARHPLADARRRGLPITIVIIVIWVTWIGWTPEQVTALLAVLLPGVYVAARGPRA